jgi:hypothetical protein
MSDFVDKGVSSRTILTAWDGSKVELIRREVQSASLWRGRGLVQKPTNTGRVVGRHH